MKARHWSWWFLSGEELKAACKKAGHKGELTEEQRGEIAKRLKALIEVSCPVWQTWVTEVVKAVMQGRELR